MPEADRAELLAGRLRRHHLDRPAAAPAAVDALTCGFQDSGDGTGDASLALRCGGAEQISSAIRTGELVAALTLRGAPHLHRAEDLAMLRSAMSSTSTADLEAVNGPLDAAIRDHDDPVGEIADAIGHTVADQHGELSKADLSTAVTQRLDDRILVYCARCAARHAPDGLFRLATLRARLVSVPGTRTQTFRRYAAAEDTGLPTVAERTEARRRLCAAAAGLSEPHDPGQLAGWLGWDVASVRATEAAPDRAPRSRKPLRRARLLPQRDPWLRGSDRGWLLGDNAGRRKEIFRALGAPGIVLLDGEIVGSWRQRKAGTSVDVEVTGWQKWPAEVEDELRLDAGILGAVRDLTPRMSVHRD